MYQSVMFASTVGAKGVKRKNPPFSPTQEKGDDTCLLTHDEQGNVRRVYVNAQIIAEKSEFFAALIDFYSGSRKVFSPSSFNPSR